jgi:transposase
VLNDLAVVAPDWLRQQVTAEWFERYGKRFEESRLPKGEAKRSAYAQRIGTDGLQLLQALYHEATPRWLQEIPTVELLRQTWVHQYYTDANGQLRLRQAKDLPPAGTRVDSPYDPEAHFGNKRSMTWTGYKVHLTGIPVTRDNLVSAMSSTGLNSITSLVTPQRTDRHGILDQKPPDFQLLS